jgi:O-antigen ligase
MGVRRVWSQAHVLRRARGHVSPGPARQPGESAEPKGRPTKRRFEILDPHLKWIALLLFTQCFLYKDTHFVPSLEIGVTVSPDRLVSIIILILAMWRFMGRTLPIHSIGSVSWYMLCFALYCTASTFLIGTGSGVLYRLFDFNYNPVMMFILARSIPHSRQKLEFLCYTFLAIGAYLAINGIFERFGPQALVWPRYILDPSIGIQYGRTRGSFASSEALGQALAVCFLFYAMYATHVRGLKLCCTHLMILVLSIVVYATNQRAAWLSFGMCLALLALTKTELKRVSRVFLGLALVGFLSGVGTHFSFWDATLFSRRQNTVDYRKVNNRTTLEMGKANPIFGVGFGNFMSTWPLYFRPEGADVRDLTDGNHNTFLGLFAETGLVGLTLYLVIFCSMFRVGLRVYRKGTGLEREFALIFLLAVLVYVFGGNFSDYRSGQFFNTSLVLLFGTVAAIDLQMASAARRAAQERSRRKFESALGTFTRAQMVKS